MGQMKLRNNINLQFDGLRLNYLVSISEWYWIDIAIIAFSRRRSWIGIEIVFCINWDIEAFEFLVHFVCCSFVDGALEHSAQNDLFSVIHCQTIVSMYLPMTLNGENISRDPGAIYESSNPFFVLLASQKSPMNWIESLRVFQLNNSQKTSRL